MTVPVLYFSPTKPFLMELSFQVKKSILRSRNVPTNFLLVKSDFKVFS